MFTYYGCAYHTKDNYRQSYFIMIYIFLDVIFWQSLPSLLISLLTLLLDIL